ncbi:Mu-like prophage major head subunit gpT family protein [Rhodocista pekingensis]|uniref:Mu-like prophage major head subunit gpT family protein n=1 Tax=Rhodocista pekingensis TaxID=201185 RepID=A0ABW2KSF5_9PROT
MNASILYDHTSPDVLRSCMADAISARSTGAVPPDHAREFWGWGLMDMAAELANKRGARLDPRDRAATAEAILSRSGQHTTSDFPLLLQDAGNKILLPRYQAAAPTYRAFAAQRRFGSFQPHRFLQLGDFPALKEIAEGAEVRFGSIGEGGEAITAKEYGAGVAISRRALINDDLGALVDFLGLAAVRAAQDENTIVYTLLASDGPTLSDGNTLFGTAHGNKAASGTAVDVTNVGAAVAAMRNQTSLDGIKMNIGPRYLVVGTANEMTARQLLTGITPAQAAAVNPYASAFALVVDPNVTGNRWMMFADPMAAPVVVYGYVGDAAGPQVRTQIDFNTRALKVAVGLDFAAGVIDYRGTYLNPGV